MNPHYHYETVSQAMAELKQRGYSIDFNLEENCLSCKHGKFNTDEFSIVDVYRYEGDSDPADEATVYAIESNTGLKGVLVTGFGANADPASAEILQKLGKH